MTWADAAKFAFQMSLAVLVFGSGLGARFADVTSLLRQPGLLVRSLLAIFVLAPLLAVLLVRVLDLGAEVSIALVALAISPLPPLLPKRGGKAGGDTEYGLGLVIVLAVLAVPVIVAAVALLQIVFGRQYAAEPWAITRLVALSIVVPLAAGMTIAKVKPALAQRLSGPIERAQRWLLPIAMVVLVISAVPQIRPLIGTLTLLAFGVFVLGGFAIGQLLGGRDPHRAVVLAFATSCRHPATALVLASANFPGAQERGAAGAAVAIPFAGPLPDVAAIGADTGSSVTPDYDPPFRFDGRIHRVIVDVSGEHVEDHEAQMRIALTKQ